MDDQLVDALRTALAQAETELQGLQREADALATRIQEITRVKTALEYTISRRTRLVREVRGDEVWTLMSRRAAIVKALGEAARPLSPTDLAAALAEHGRHDTARAVSATLSQLKLDGRVQSVGYSKWVAVPNGGSPNYSGLESGDPEPQKQEPPDEGIA